MKEPARKPAKKKSFSGNHQRSWLWGRHAVLETLQADRWPVLEIYVSPEALEQSSDLLDRQRRAGVPIEVVSATRLEQLCRSSEHQGHVIRMGSFPYLPLDQLASDVRRGITEQVFPPPLVVMCDRIQDTFNFGAILRCCDGAGALAVVVGEQHQAEVTPHVARASSGAANHVPVARVGDTACAIGLLKSCGLQAVAADANVEQSIWHAPLAAPTVLIIGSEAHGIRPELLDQCDQRVCIPMRGQVSSLNAAVAAGIMLYEIRRQQSAHD